MYISTVMFVKYHAYKNTTPNVTLHEVINVNIVTQKYKNWELGTKQIQLSHNSFSFTTPVKAIT